MKQFVTFFLSEIVVLLLVTNLFAQWEPDVRLTYDSAYSYTSLNNAWCIAANGDTIHVVWMDGRDGNSEVYYKRSTDGGTTWEADTGLAVDIFQSQRPSIAASGSYVHVVWHDARDGNNEIYYKRSTDGGTSWGADTRLTDDSASSELASVAVLVSYVHTVWEDDRDGNREIYYKSSTDGGTTWGADTRLTDDPDSSLEASVAVSNSGVHVVWYDNRDGNREIYYKRSTDGGTTWEIDTRLTDDPAWSYFPSVGASGDSIHVFWNDTRISPTNNEIYYKHSTDGGTTWGIDTRLTNAPVLSERPSAVVSESNVHIVWEDRRNGNTEIYYKYSSNGGTNWGTDIRLTDDPGNSECPSTAVSGTNIHVVWDDNRDGNNEIYYKRNPTGNVVVEEASNYQYSISNEQLTVCPNPFTSSTTVLLNLPSIGHSAEGIELNIYDLSGRIVKSFSLPTVFSPLPTGVTWDGKDAKGGEVKHGIYFFKVKGCKPVKVVKLR